ncbi:MAG: GGDEF domain-containing protein [Gammaproteobacteria bacterium]|nr:GGDEF domain-containing protein [Gammaproteobacteria bacterium]
MLFTKVEHAWAEQARRSAQVSESLSEMHRVVGYGGFIHNFKNLVLRKDVARYQDSLYRDLNKINSVMDKLETIIGDDIRKGAIKQFRTTFKEYERNLSIVIEMINQGATVDQIDDVVKVHDKPALDAIKLLENYSKIDLAATKHRTNQLSRNATRFLLVSEISLVFFVVFGVMSLIRFQSSLVKANRELEATNKRLDSLLENSPDAMLTVDENGEIVRANRMAEQFFGYTSDELNGMKIENLMPEEYRSSHVQMRESYFELPSLRPMGRDMPLVALKRDGSQPNVDISLSYLEEAGGRFVNVSLRDTTVIEEYKRALKEEATHDQLTGLSNRRGFYAVAKHEIERARRSQTELWIVMIDVDDFKTINDKVGHTTGDEVLKSVARVMEESIRKVDLLCRMGGDEFIILFEDTNKNGIRHVTESILANIENLTVAGWTDKGQGITVSIGCAQFVGEQELEDAIETADKALYASKRDGKNRITFYDDISDV